MARYLITGGCGFVGRNLVHELLKGGTHPRDIVVYDNLSVGKPSDLRMVAPVRHFELGATGQVPQSNGDEILLIEGDIRDAAAAQRHLRDVDVVVHLAACTGVVPAMRDPFYDCDTNVRGTLNLLEACRHNGVKRFVFASSGAPLGMVAPPVHENLPARPMSPYGASKLAGEGYCSAYFNAFGIDTVTLRFGNLYGPFSGHKTSVVAAFISAALRGEALPMHGDGSATRDFIYSEDLCRAIIRASEQKNIGGETFQISTGDELSVAELCTEMLEIFEEAGLGRVTVTNMPPRPVDIQRTFADASKARNVMGWSPKFDRRTALRKTLNWFMSQKQ